MHCALQVHWDKEEEDFEGYVRDYEPGGDFPYEVAYDDGDEEWGHFSATHFHTDEVNRKYTWLTEQDVAVSAAAAAVWAQQKLTDAKSSVFEPASAQTQAPPATASNARPSVSLATQKGLLRANQSKAQLEKADNVKQSLGSQPLPSSNGKAISSTQEQQAAANDKDSKPDREAHVVQNKSVVKAKAASPAADEEAAIAPNKRRRISPAKDSTTPPKLRDSTPRMPAESSLAAETTAAAAHPSPASAKQAQQQGVLKEPKLRRLRKASDVSAAAHTAEQPVQAPDLEHVQVSTHQQHDDTWNCATSADQTKA